MSSVNKADLNFDDRGLIPAIVVDNTSGKVLTLAYMNRESLDITLEEGRTCFWSRSRKELWRKGETSGNVQYVKNIVADCDGDALLIYVDKTGPACHLGNDSCFEFPLEDFDLGADGSIGDMGAAASSASDGALLSINGLYELLKDRKDKMPEGSYTTYLFEKGMDKILKKIGEESTEVVIAGKAEDRAEAIYEISDLVYHLLVLMVEMGIEVEDIISELDSRHVIDKKVKQEKMV